VGTVLETKFTKAVPQAVIPAIAPTLANQGVEVPTDPTLNEAAAVGFDDSVGAQSIEVWHYYGTTWYKAASSTTDAVAQKYVFSFMITPRPTRVCLVGTANITTAEFYFGR